MTDNITLPRSVVEQALEALDEADLLMEHRQNIELRRSALVALRAALEQPDIEIPASVPEGWKLVPVEPTDDMLYDIQEYSHILPPRGRRIWAHMLAAAPQPPALEQPQVKQGPIWYHKHWAEDNDIFYRPTEAVPDGAVPLYLHPQNLNCKSNQARLATLWGYVKEQPPRRPLTVGQINRLIADGKLPLSGNPYEVARAIERAHGIGGEK